MIYLIDEMFSIFLMRVALKWFHMETCSFFSAQTSRLSSKQVRQSITSRWMPSYYNLVT